MHNFGNIPIVVREFIHFENYSLIKFDLQNICKKKLVEKYKLIFYFTLLPWQTTMLK